MANVNSNEGIPSVIDPVLSYAKARAVLADISQSTLDRMFASGKLSRVKLTSNRGGVLASQVAALIEAGVSAPDSGETTS